MKKWGNKRYYSLDYHYKKIFGKKVYKLSIDAGFTCPNRDGKVSHGGCIFCSEGGSGENAGERKYSVTQQILDQKEFIKSKYNDGAYIAYFQAFTNTYANIDYLRKVYYEALNNPDIVGISIATRPDCLDTDVLDLIDEISRIKKVWIELGLQTIHDKTAKIINRGYKYNTFLDAINKLSKLNIEVCVHLILGLPYETLDDMKESLLAMNKINIHGIKLHLLHIIKNTKLEKIYNDNKITTFEMKEYAEFIIWCITHLRDDIVIHRLTGDGIKESLVAPLWSLRKIDVLNYIDHNLKVRNLYQGCEYE